MERPVVSMSVEGVGMHKAQVHKAHRPVLAHTISREL